MALSTDRAAFKLVRRFLVSKGPIVPVVDTPPQKPSCPPPRAVYLPLPRATPESQGILSDSLAGFLAALRDDRTLDPHAVVVLRNGRVLSTASFGAYDLGIPHVTHSAAKSIVSLAIGMLVDEDRLSLDDRVVEIFADRATPFARLTHRNLTVRHLLTMTSGVVYNEVASVTETDWVGRYLESVRLSEPGAVFFYNSMNTYLLSAIVKQVTGQGLVDFLQPRLWEPLGITGIFWERCPKGIEKGGWGLYIRLEDLAKVGQLVLQQGVWNGRRLISEAWLRDATTAQRKLDEELGGFDYGFHTWVGRTRPSFLFNGMFGQNVLGFPETGVLVAVNAGNHEMFQQSRFFVHAERWFGALPAQSVRLAEDPRALAGLRALEESLRRCGPEDAADFPWPDVLGRRFLVPHESREAASTVGLLPFFLQGMQNHYAKGLRGLSFEGSAEVPVLVVEEADETHRLPVGYRTARTTELVFRGEPFRVGVAGWREDEPGGPPALCIRVSFLEAANSRMLRIVFRDGGAVAHWTEIPGKDLLVRGLELLRVRVTDNPLLKRAGRAGSTYLRDRVEKLLEPVTKLVEETEERPAEPAGSPSIRS